LQEEHWGKFPLVFLLSQYTPLHEIRMNQNRRYHLKRFPRKY
jgi:hypothetical protein